MLRKSLLPMLLFILCPVISNAQSEKIKWSANNNDYQLISAGSAISWNNANDAAIALGGHLATITSQQEQAWVQSMFDMTKQIWVGGYQNPSHNEPPYDQGWMWVTSEPWDYTAWGSGEPNNYGSQNQDYLVLWVDHGGLWNDAIYNDSRVSHYLVEWENVVPEPLSVGMLCAGILGLVIAKRKKSQ